MPRDCHLECAKAMMCLLNMKHRDFMALLETGMALAGDPEKGTLVQVRHFVDCERYKWR